MSSSALLDAVALTSRYATEELTVEILSGGGWFSKVGWEHFGYALSRELTDRCRHVNGLVRQLADIPNVAFSYKLACDMRYAPFVAGGLSMSWLLAYLSRLHSSREVPVGGVRDSLVRPDWRCFMACVSVEAKFTDRSQAFTFEVLRAQSGVLGKSVLFDAIVHAMRASRRDNRTRLFLVVNGTSGREVMRFSAYGAALDGIFTLSPEGRQHAIKKEAI